VEFLSGRASACVKCLQVRAPAAQSLCTYFVTHAIESEHEPEARDNETPVPVAVRVKEITKLKNDFSLPLWKDTLRSGDSTRNGCCALHVLYCESSD
jgi:hypothetical protein